MEYEQAWGQAGWILANFVFILRVYGQETVKVHVQATYWRKMDKAKFRTSWLNYIGQSPVITPGPNQSARTGSLHELLHVAG